MTDVVLPCLNEAPALPGLLERLPAGYRAIVADNGSTDGSAEAGPLAGRPGWCTCRNPVTAPPCTPGSRPPTRTTGSSACSTRTARSTRGSCPGVADPVRLGLADLAVGRRRPTIRAAWPVHARLGNALLARRLRRTTGLDVHDIGPMRAARRDDLLGLGLRDRRFGYPLELFVAVGRAGWRVTEVDVDYGPRAAGTKSKGPPGRSRAPYGRSGT